MVVLQIYLILFCIEMLIVVLLGYMNFPVWQAMDFQSIYSIVMVKLISCLAMLIIEKQKGVQPDIPLPFSSRIEIFIIPIASLVYCLFYFHLLH